MGRYVVLLGVLLAITAAWTATPAEIDRQLYLLHNHTYWHAAVDALAGMGKSAVPALLRALDDPNPFVRSRAYDVLERIPGALTNDRRILLLSDPALASSVNYRIDRKWLPTQAQLHRLLDTDDEKVLAHVESILLRQEKPPLDLLAVLLHDPSAQVRRSSLRMVDRFAYTSSTSATWLRCSQGVIDALIDQDTDVRKAALMLVQQRRALVASSVAPLIPLLASDDRSTHLGAVGLIAASIDPNRTNILLDAYEKGDAAVRQSLLEGGLAYLQDPRITAIYTTAIQDPSALIRQAAVRGLQYPRVKTRLPAALLLPLLQDTDRSVVYLVEYLLAGIYREPATIPWLITRLTANDDRSDSAVTSLARIGDSAAPALLAVLHGNPIPQTRRRVVQADELL